MYEAETRVLNQSVKRNIDRFPTEFMFQLSSEEWQQVSSSQIVMIKELPRNRTGTYLPYAFTEHGVTMLASVLRSKKAIAMNIAIVNAFIALRHFALTYKELTEQINELKNTVGNHDTQLNRIYEALENLLNAKKEEKAWENREPIGFKLKK